MVHYDYCEICMLCIMYYIYLRVFSSVMTVFELNGDSQAEKTKLRIFGGGGGCWWYRRLRQYENKLLSRKEYLLSPVKTGVVGMSIQFSATNTTASDVGISNYNYVHRYFSNWRDSCCLRRKPLVIKYYIYNQYRKTLNDDHGEREVTTYFLVQTVL